MFSQSLLSLDLIEDMLQSLEDRAQQEREEGSQDLDKQVRQIILYIALEVFIKSNIGVSEKER